MSGDTIAIVWMTVGAIAALCAMFWIGANGWDGDTTMPALMLCAIWPIALAACVAYGVVSAPFWIGVQVRKRRERIERDYEEVRKMIQP